MPYIDKERKKAVFFYFFKYALSDYLLTILGNVNQ